MSTDIPDADARVEVLIAEDSPTQSRRLQYILEKQGYQVTITHNGRQALQEAQRQRPTLIISDVVMPEMDGYELCRRIKSDSSLGDIPIILVTTLSDPEDVIRGLECGADNFILKPYDEPHLLSRLQFVLMNRETKKETEQGEPVEIFFNGQKHFIKADRLQILNLLLSTYDAAIQRNKELTLTKDDLHRLNASLEDANKELEAFSYSVSHDLRAPLRVVDGFLGILSRKHSAQMPQDAQQLLSQVSASARHMGELIDALLRLAHLSRQPLSKRSVKLSLLVDTVLEELRKEQGERNIEIKLEVLPDSVGDPELLKQVFVNLLSNAFKYTRHKDRAVIEIGWRQEVGEKTYFIRDNGAGFDMRYAGKLFNVFQRFHRAEEFEGTGVGLSIVQRIIQRHGGRIRAEAEVDKGAAFFVTLPE